MILTLANPRGFCDGVKRAIQMLDDLLADESVTSDTIYVYHEIVHNTRVVESFRHRGVVFVQSLDEVPSGATLLFSAHGVSPVVRQVACDKKLNVIDATCPLVERLHCQARQLTQEGYLLLLIGHRGHDEVAGIVGEAPDRTTVLSQPEEIESLRFPHDQKLAVLVQTTFLASAAQSLIDAIAHLFPQLLIPQKLTVCNATQVRQDALRRYQGRCDLALVIGSANSSNTIRLTEVASERGWTVVRIDSAEELEIASLHETSHLLLTGGASAPEEIIQECIAKLAFHFPLEVTEQ